MTENKLFLERDLRKSTFSFKFYGRYGNRNWKISNGIKTNE